MTFSVQLVLEYGFGICRTSPSLEYFVQDGEFVASVPFGMYKTADWYKYYIFGAFNAAAFIHMGLMAPETKGYTLEEMDDVFDSGLPAWKTHQKTSRLEQLERDIEAGNLKVGSPLGRGQVPAGEKTF